MNCGPRGFPPAGIALIATTEMERLPTSRTAGIAHATESYGMTVVTADFDEDGWPDIFVACDSTPSLLFMNNHDGTFARKVSCEASPLSDDGMEQAGMGVGVGDYNLDGHLDLFKTHFIGDTSGFYRNDGKGEFRRSDATEPRSEWKRGLRVGAQECSISTTMAIRTCFLVTGSVYPEVERKLPQYPYKTQRVLFRNLGNGTFEELDTQAGPGSLTPHSSRGCAFGDFDNDGDMDVLIVNMNEPPSLLRNDITGKQNWLKVKLEGVKSNRGAIGARVLVRYGTKVQAQTVLSQSSYYSCNDPRLHFGLGATTLADIDVYWPNGLHEQHKKIAANRLITIRESVGIVRNKGWSR